MTRKEALQEAMDLIQKSRIGKQRKQDILQKLAMCQQELPFAKWTQDAIFDACDQYILDHNRNLTTAAFLDKNLPSHPVIQNRFGMTAREFRDRYYPLKTTLSVHSKYRSASIKVWNEIFIREFHELRVTGMRDYNKRRDKNHPSSVTLVRHNHLTSWTELLQKLGLRCYQRNMVAIQFEVDL